ncbi:MAG: hypothetical protein WBH36_19020, partial [Syntrophobacteria bacterium]
PEHLPSPCLRNNGNFLRAFYFQLVSVRKRLSVILSPSTLRQAQGRQAPRDYARDRQDKNLS